jgi:transposase
VAIGLETAHSLLIDFLVDHGYPHLYVLPPGQVHANQSRFTQSKAKDDPHDARLIADILRTDQGRHRPWHPDRPLTRQIQVQVRYVLYLSRMIRRQTNHLRAALLRYYPMAVDLFSKLDSPIALAFLQAYPTPQQALQLSPEDFQTFLRQHRYPQTGRWSTLYERLHAAYPQARPDTLALYQAQVPQLAEQLGLFVRQKRQALAHLQDLFVQHPDGFIYTSLPGAGEFLAPGLLAELGDDRGRYPSLQVLQAIAGTCPITQRSGKHRVIRFRRACDRQFRYIVTLWAGMALKRAPWAQTYYDQLVRRGIPHTDAIRRVANRFLAILWKLWQTRTPYQESVHLQQRLARAKPRA